MTTTPPRCSVIVPTYNRRDLLRHTLESLARQSLPRDEYEVIVADDGSSDDTDAMVATFHDRLNLQYHFQPDEGYASAKARNLGLRHASAPVSVLIDAGVLLHSDALAAHCEVHEKADEPLAVIGYVWGFDERDEDFSKLIDADDADGTIRRLAERNAYRDVREWYYDHYGEELWKLYAPWAVYWTCNVSANTEQLRRIGMFDENFRSWGGEDIDLAYRLHRDGARFVLCREAASIHLPHPKDDTSSARANAEYIAAKYDTPITRIWPYTDHFLVEVAVREQGLPSCAEYRASLAAADAAVDGGV